MIIYSYKSGVAMHKINVRMLCIFFSIISLFNSVYSSLPSGTKIATSKGLVCVEKLKVGDKVLSYNAGASEHENAIVEVVVTNVDKHLTESVFSIYTGKHVWIDASPKQLFFAIDRSKDPDNKTATVNFVEAQYLTTDHELVDSSMQFVPIVKIGKAELCTTKHSVEKTMIKVYVYALEVEEPHTLLVAESFYDENIYDKPRLILTHNGIPELGLGVALAFGSNPSSISLAKASATLGGLEAELGPAGLAVGLAVGFGILGYNLYKSKDKKRSTDYFECADSCASPGGLDPKDQKDRKDINLKDGKPVELGSKTGYKFKNGVDIDFRGTGKTSADALNEAFKKTETPRSEFEVTKWRRDANGKTFPVDRKRPYFS